MGAQSVTGLGPGREVAGDRAANSVRALTLHACASATRDMFGESVLREVMGSTRTVEEREWVPVEQIMSICECLWDGVMARDGAVLRRWTDGVLDHGFGRVSRLFLSIATPAVLVRRAADLWRGEFSDGRLVAYTTSETSARLSLHEHRFLETALMRDVVSESYRYAVCLTGATGARETHIMRDTGALTVDLTW